MILDENGHYVDAPFHDWFGLTYSGYLVFPRAILEALPPDLQNRMIAVIDEARELLDTTKISDNYSVKLRDQDGRYIVDPFANYRHPPAVPMRAAS